MNILKTINNNFSYVIVSHNDNNFKKPLLLNKLFCQNILKISDADKISLIRIGNQNCPTQIVGIEVDDDYDENISYLNKYLNELTGIHTTWKKYKTICNNADRIYFNHYRRLFVAKDDDYKLDGLFHNNSSNGFTFRQTVDISYRHGKDKLQVESILMVLDEMQNRINEWEFDDVLQTKHQFKYSTKFYIYSMFMLKKELFFKYCEWLFPYAIKIMKLYEELCLSNTTLNLYPRTPGYICEFLSSIFFERCMTDKNLKTDTRDIEFI